jgi:hypothetical protein
MNLDADAARTRFAMSWILTPVGAWLWGAGVIAAVVLVPQLGAGGEGAAAVLAFYAHRDLKAHDRRAFAWTLAVVLLGFFAFIPYTYKRRAWANEDVAATPVSSPALEELEATRPTKTCPDCAQHVLAEARICRFCRHVFDDVAPPDSA